MGSTLSTIDFKQRTKTSKAFIMKNKEKNIALFGAAVFLAIATAIGTFIRKL